MYKESFKIISQDLDARFQKVCQRIRRLQSGGTIDSLQTIGADTDNQVGASFVPLKQLASHYSPDEDLALLLWDTRKREEQIIACFLFPTTTNKEKITQLEKNCLNFEIAGYLGSLYLCKRSDLAEITWPLIETDRPYLQAATLTALARYLILNKKDDKITKAFFQSVLNYEFPNKYVSLMAERYRFNI